jgi:hypothetical protein
MGDPDSARGHSMLGASDRTTIHDPPPPRDGGLGSESELTGPPQRGSLTVKASLPGCTVGARYGGAQFAGGSMRYELKDVVISNCAPGSVTLDAGAASVFDADGSALVIHAGPDDQHSDPSGNSGARIACGVITRAP